MHESQRTPNAPLTQQLHVPRILLQLLRQHLPRAHEPAGDVLRPGNKIALLLVLPLQYTDGGTSEKLLALR